MKKTDSLFNKNLPPLAERVRPKIIDNFIGQDHLIGPNKIINQMLSKKKHYSMILWGPPGSGKTTLLRSINGLENIDNGEIFLDDKKIDKIYLS